MYAAWLAAGSHKSKAVDVSHVAEYATLPEGRQLVSAKVMGWLDAFLQGKRAHV